MQRVQVRPGPDGEWLMEPVVAGSEANAPKPAGFADAPAAALAVPAPQLAMSTELADAAQSIRRLARSMQATFDAQRLSLTARLTGAEQRDTPRWTLIVPAWLTLDGQEHPVQTCNIGSAGVILAQDKLGLMRIDHVGAWPVRVATLTLERLAVSHVAETMPDGVAVRLERLLAALEARNRAELAAVCSLAAAAEAALESLVDTGRLSAAALFAEALRPVAGSEPAQFTKPGSRLIAQALAPLLDRFCDVFPEGSFDVSVIDSHGHRAAQDRRHGAPQQPGEPLANAHLSRNLAYDPSLTALAAARLSPDPLIHTVERPLDPAFGALARTASAPIRIHGRRWGAVQAAWFGSEADWLRTAAGSAAPSPA
jgi:hypothetical protein